ncbi:MAG: MarR family transcriptional regulator [Clostridia bacterium]|nr:MarR family transcriptional regulator [Clostridia bacterium]
MNERFDKFTFLIWEIYRSIQKIKKQEMENMGLKGNQVSCLYQLYNNKDGKTSTELCALCGDDKATISRTLSELEKEGYVFVEESDSQKYKNPYKLTDLGRKVGKTVSDKIDQMLNAGSEGIKENEREKFYEQLSLVLSNLQKIQEKYGD